MIKFNNDIIINISDNLILLDIIKLSVTNKNFHQMFDENFYKILAIKYYTKGFWHKAYQRPKHFSKPLKNIKMELIRIEKFQLMLDKLNIKRWRQKDFYEYWKNNDKMIFNI